NPNRGVNHKLEVHLLPVKSIRTQLLLVKLSSFSRDYRPADW
ncbi:hypothetical protein JMJ77_0003124, partial [Colletotrichum scovillei]